MSQEKEEVGSKVQSLTTFDDELLSAISIRHLVRQVQAASVRKPQKELIATYAPELLFRAEQAEKYHISLQPQPSSIPYDATQSEVKKLQQQQTGFIETQKLLALDVEVQQANRDNAFKSRPLNRSKMLGGDLSAAEIRAQVEEELEMKRHAAEMAKGETAARSLVIMHSFELPEHAFGWDYKKQQACFRSLLYGTGLHSYLHRTSNAHRIKLKLAPSGGPSDDNNTDGDIDDFMTSKSSKNGLPPPPSGIRHGQVCSFGVAPIVGITVNHPYAKSANKTFPNSSLDTLTNNSSISSAIVPTPHIQNRPNRRIESIGVIYLWGSGGNMYERLKNGKRISSAAASRWIAGVAACLTSLHSQNLCLGRLSCHSVGIYPREQRATKPGSAGQVLIPDAKVTDLSHVVKPTRQSFNNDGVDDDNTKDVTIKNHDQRQEIKNELNSKNAIVVKAKVGDDKDETPSSTPSFENHTRNDEYDDGNMCAWRMRDLVSDAVYLPHGVELDDEGEACEAHDLWYLGCLGLEILMKAPLTTCQYGRIKDMTARQIDALIPSRFSEDLKQIVSALLLKEESSRPKAADVLEKLAPKEAARLRGESLRGWAKKRAMMNKNLKDLSNNPTVVSNDFMNDDEGDEVDTDSGSDANENDSDDGSGSGSGSDSEDGDEEYTYENDDGSASGGRYRYGVNEAVFRANKRVIAYNRAAWWAGLSEERRCNILHRRLTRRMSKSRISFMKFCLKECSMFKEWGNRDAALWYKRCVTMGVLANQLEPFTQPHKDALLDLDDDEDDDDDDEDDDEDDHGNDNGDDDDDGNKKHGEHKKGTEKSPEEIKQDLNNQAIVLSNPNRLVGNIADGEDLGKMLRQLQRAGSHYDLTDRAATFGLTPSLIPVRSGAAGDMGGNEETDAEEMKLELKRQKKLQQANLSLAVIAPPPPPPTIPEPREPPPNVPPPFLYESNPYVSASERASLEWKANGYVYYAAISDALEEADEDFALLMKTAFAYEEPAVHTEKLLHLRVARIREQQTLKSIIERTVSIAEPSTPSDAQVDRASCMISLSLLQGFLHATQWGEVGRHWGSSVIGAWYRGILVRRLVSEVWNKATFLARQTMELEENRAVELQDAYRRNMAEREEQVRMSDTRDIAFVPKVVLRGSRKFGLGLPHVATSLVKKLEKIGKLIWLSAELSYECEQRGLDGCVGIINVSVDIGSKEQKKRKKDDDRSKSSSKMSSTCFVKGLIPASAYLLRFSVDEDKNKEAFELLSQEDPSWVKGDAVIVEEMTRGDTPSSPTIQVNMATLIQASSTSAAAAGVLVSTPTASFAPSAIDTLPAVSKTRKQYGLKEMRNKPSPSFKSSAMSQVEIQRPVAHLSWSIPLKVNGSPIAFYRIQRRFILVFCAPPSKTKTNDVLKNSQMLNEKNAEEEGKEEKDMKKENKRSNEVFGLFTRWSIVFQGDCLEWSDMFEEVSQQIQELNTLSANSTLPPISSNNIKYNMTDHKDSSSGFKAIKSEDIDMTVFDFKFSGLPPGVGLLVEYKVAARNSFGWGRSSKPESAPVKALENLVVTLSEEWIDAYESMATQHSEKVPLPLHQPQQVTDGIFHSFLKLPSIELSPRIPPSSTSGSDDDGGGVNSVKANSKRHPLDKTMSAVPQQRSSAHFKQQQQRRVSQSIDIGVKVPSIKKKKAPIAATTAATFSTSVSSTSQADSKERVDMRIPSAEEDNLGMIGFIDDVITLQTSSLSVEKPLVLGRVQEEDMTQHLMERGISSYTSSLKASGGASGAYSGVTKSDSKDSSHFTPKLPLYSSNQGKMANQINPHIVSSSISKKQGINEERQKGKNNQVFINPTCKKKTKDGME